MSKRSGSQPEPRDASTRGAEEAGSRPNTDGIDGLRMEPELMLDLARKAAELVVERIEPAFLTGFRREEPETPSGKGARPEGTGGVLDSTSRSPTKRNAALADVYGAAADNS